MSSVGKRVVMMQSRRVCLCNIAFLSTGSTYRLWSIIFMNSSLWMVSS